MLLPSTRIRNQTRINGLTTDPRSDTRSGFPAATAAWDRVGPVGLGRWSRSGSDPARRFGPGPVGFGRGPVGFGGPGRRASGLVAAVPGSASLSALVAPGFLAASLVGGRGASRLGPPVIAAGWLWRRR